MHNAHLLMTANPPTYFFIMLNAVKVTHKYDKNPHCCSINLSHSLSLLARPLSPTDICTVWQSIISHHLQKACIGGSRDPYLYLIFIPPQQQEWWSCQLKPSVNLLPKPKRDNSHHICGWRAACLMQTQSHHPCWLSQWVWKLHKVSQSVCEKLILLRYSTETLKIFMKHLNKWQILDEGKPTKYELTKSTTEPEGRLIIHMTF